MTSNNILLLDVACYNGEFLLILSAALAHSHCSLCYCNCITIYDNVTRCARFRKEKTEKENLTEEKKSNRAVERVLPILTDFFLGNAVHL